LLILVYSVVLICYYFSYALAIATTSVASPSPAASAAQVAPAPVAPKVDEIDDLFGEDNVYEQAEGATEEERIANAARQKRMALAKKLKEEKDAKEGKKKEAKAKAVEKSLVVLEVKPWEADCNLENVWKEITKYQQDGLTWGQSFKLEPVAYGIMKLVMTCTIVDSLVLLDDITDNIEAMEEFVQSVNVASMNKIS